MRYITFMFITLILSVSSCSDTHRGGNGYHRVGNG